MQHFRWKGEVPNSSPLEAVSLCEFLEGDARPTFILDVEHSHVAYQNPALANHSRSRSWDDVTFYRWIVSLASDNTSANLRFADRTWEATRLQHKYLVVNTSCGNIPPQTPDDTPLATPIGPYPPRVPERSWTGDSSMSSSSHTRGSRRKSLGSSSWRTISVSEDSGESAPPPPGTLDWTRYNMPGLSRHVQLIKSLPWHTTSVGSMETWPETLRSAVVYINSNPKPRLVLWAEDYTMIYNEACIPIFGQNHPRALGCSPEVIWAELWNVLHPMCLAATNEGKCTNFSNLPLPMLRNGYPEETFWSFSLIPIVGSGGKAVGVIDEFTESTTQVVGDRRRATVMRINQLVAQVSTVKELWHEYLQCLEKDHDDIVYAMLYSSSSNGDHSAAPDTASHYYSLEGTIGLPSDQSLVPLTFELDDCVPKTNSLASACCTAVREGEVVTLQQMDGTLPPEMAIGVPGRAAGEQVNTVCILPIPDMFSVNQRAFVVIALSPRRPYDSEYTTFVHNLRDVLLKSASTIFLPEEHRRVRQKFEEIETNLAHQLRTTALEAQRIEAQYTKMFQLAPVGMFAITPDSRTTFYNDAYLSITGISQYEAELASANTRDAIHEDDSESVMECWLRCLQDKLPFTHEYRVRKQHSHIDAASGKEIVGDSWVVCKAMPELDRDGNIIHIQGYLMDVSDRKYHESLRIAQIENERSEVRFARLAETAPLGMYLFKPDGKPIYLNDAYFELLGITREEFGRAESVVWGDQIFEEDVPRTLAAWKDLTEHGVPLHLEYRIKKQWRSHDPTSGIEMTGPTWLQSTAVAELGSDNKPIAVQGFVTEISLKKFSERLLAERLEEALETKRAADRFIDMTSHEMRNPLSAMLQSADGILTTLQASGLPILGEDVSMSEDTMETLLDSAQTIILCAQHSKRIVDDILTLSKLDSNLLVISPDDVSAPRLLERSFKMYEAELDRAGVYACLAIEQSYIDLHIDNVMLDSSRLLQVVINLLSNAIKFMQFEETRRITIYLGASSGQPTEGHRGVSMIERRKNRAEHTMSSDWGEGEDVYLQIAVEDTGRGLDADELALLFQRFSQASPKTYKQYGGSGLGLFISRELTELQGGQIGVTSEAGKGSIFAFYVKARRCVPRPDDLVLSRMQSPSLQSPSLRPIPVPSWSRKGSVTAMDAVLALAEKTPPTPRQPLKRTLSTTRSKTPQPASPVSQLHVLVVEDNVINQRVMAQQLRRLGCIVHLANHGLEALEFLKTTIYWNDSATTLSPTSLQTATPLSVILMDLEMPVLGGLECVKRIRELQAKGQLTVHVPVIAVTANARSEQIAVAINHGMDTVVTKPFRIPELIPKMTELVEKLGMAME